MKDAITTDGINWELRRIERAREQIAWLLEDIKISEQEIETRVLCEYSAKEVEKAKEDFAFTNGEPFTYKQKLEQMTDGELSDEIETVLGVKPDFHEYDREQYISELDLLNWDLENQQKVKI